MSRSRYLNIVPIVFLLVASFVMGFHVQDALAASASGDWTLKDWTVALQKIPSQIERLLERPQDSQPGDLPVLETYWAVLERVAEDFYPQKIDGQDPEALDQHKLTYAAIRGMLRSLDDPFTRFLDPKEYEKMVEENTGNFVGIGARLDTNDKRQVYILMPLPNTPAEKAGLKKNDVILKVDDEPISGMDIDEVVNKIRGMENTKVKLTLLREGATEPFDVTIVRRWVEVPIVDSRMQDPDNKIGYVKLWQFNEKSDSQFDKALTELEKENMKALIFDLRGNPGGLLEVAIDIGSRFIESGPVVIIQERGGQRTPHFVKSSKHNHKRYPLVVLVDKHSASASEIVAGAIRDNDKGTLLGTTTFGKGRVQTIMPLRDGSAVAITTAKYLTPSGTDINKVGIKPDVVFEQPEDADPTDPEKDPLLLKAQQLLMDQLAGKTATAAAAPASSAPGTQPR